MFINRKTRKLRSYFKNILRPFLRVAFRYNLNTFRNGTLRNLGTKLITQKSRHPVQKWERCVSFQGVHITFDTFLGPFQKAIWYSVQCEHFSSLLRTSGRLLRCSYKVTYICMDLLLIIKVFCTMLMIHLFDYGITLCKCFN